MIKSFSFSPIVYDVILLSGKTQLLSGNPVVVLLQHKNVGHDVSVAPRSLFSSKKKPQEGDASCFKICDIKFIFLVIDIIFTKNDFWHYVYAKFHTFFVKYIFEKKNILSCISGFIRIRVFRVMLSIRWMMKHIH